MTTIACRNSVMAADSQSSWDGIRGFRTKIERVNGALIGGAGTYEYIAAFIRWFKAGADTDNLPESRQYRGGDDAPEFNILVLSENGLVHWGPHFQPVHIEDEFWAVGSGMSAAIAAMHMGADAFRAVEIASLVDVNTGGKIQVERLDDARLRQ